MIINLTQKRKSYFAIEGLSLKPLQPDQRIMSAQIMKKKIVKISNYKLIKTFSITDLLIIVSCQ